MSHWQRTKTSNTVNEAASVISEPYLATYTISVTTGCLIAAASHTLQIMAGNLNRVILRRLQVSMIVNAGAETRCVWQLLRLTTAGTGGTAYTPKALDPVDTTSAAAGMTIPSSKGTEGNILWTGAMTVPDTTPTDDVGDLLIDLDWTDPRTKGPVIAAGTSNGLALKCVTGVATAQVHVFAEYVEAFWS